MTDGPTTDEFLAHFGVKGMHWGIRRDRDSGGTRSGPSAETVAKRGQRAQKYVAQSAAAAKLIKELDEQGIKAPAMRKMYGRAVDHSDRLFRVVTMGESKQHAVAKVRKDAQQQKDRADKDAKNVANGGLSRNQKIAIGVGVGAVALLALYGASQYKNVLTRNALAGEKISVDNFMKRYTTRAMHFGQQDITKEAFDKMSDVDHRVPKGAIFKRLTAFKDESLEKRLYVTYKESDNDKYAGIYGNVLRQRTKAKNLSDQFIDGKIDPLAALKKPQLYISEMKQNEDIVSPSQKKRIQFLIDLAKENPTITDGDGVKTTVLEHLQGHVQMQELNNVLTGKALTDVKKLSPEQLALKTYNTVARELVSESPINETYFNKVKSAGYNAIIDDNDRGQLADAPMILLNAAKTTESRNAKPLTRAMEKAARARFTELAEPDYTDVGPAEAVAKVTMKDLRNWMKEGTPDEAPAAPDDGVALLRDMINSDAAKRKAREAVNNDT